MADGSASASASKWLLYKIGKTGVVTDIPYVPFRGALIDAVKGRHKKRFEGVDFDDIIVRHWMHADKTPVDVNGNFPEVEGDAVLQAGNYYIIELPPTEEEEKRQLNNKAWHSHSEPSAYANDTQWAFVPVARYFNATKITNQMAKREAKDYRSFSKVPTGDHNTNYSVGMCTVNDGWWGDREDTALEEYQAVMSEVCSSSQHVGEKCVSFTFTTVLRNRLAPTLRLGFEEWLRAKSNMSAGAVDVVVFGRGASAGFSGVANFVHIVGIVEVERDKKAYKKPQFVGELSAATAMSRYPQVAALVWCDNSAQIALCSKNGDRVPMLIAEVADDPTKAIHMFAELCHLIDEGNHEAVSRTIAEHQPGDPPTGTRSVASASASASASAASGNTKGAGLDEQEEEVNENEDNDEVHGPNAEHLTVGAVETFTYATAHGITEANCDDVPFFVQLNKEMDPTPHLARARCGSWVNAHVQQRRAPVSA